MSRPQEPVNLEGSKAYTVTTTGISNTLTAYRPDQTVLSSGSGPRTFTTGAGGVHYIRVQAQGAGTGAYTVTAQ